MGGDGSGRPSYLFGKLTQIGVKFPISADWYHLAKRICFNRSISFSEYIRELVRLDVGRFKHNKMWPCDCVDKNGKVNYNFRHVHECPICRKYQNKHMEHLYKKR